MYRAVILFLSLPFLLLGNSVYAFAEEFPVSEDTEMCVSRQMENTGNTEDCCHANEPEKSTCPTGNKDMHCCMAASGMMVLYSISCSADFSVPEEESGKSFVSTIDFSSSDFRLIWTPPKVIS